MAGAAKHDDDDDEGMISDINVTPLVDITLVLLIIFMVTARLIVKNSALEVNLPKAASGQDVPSTLGLTIDEKGELYLNNEKVADRRAIIDFARKAVSANPEIQAVVSADRKVQHGDVIEAIDLLLQAGVKHVAEAVEKKEGEP